MRKAFLNTALVILLAGIAAYAYATRRRSEAEPTEPDGGGFDYPTTMKRPSQKNFSASEFDCKDGTAVPAEYYGNLQTLMDHLQVLRDDIGFPIHVNSGYRSPTYNAKVGGAFNSTHKKAMAGDIVVPGWTPKKVYQRIEKLIAEGKMQEGGLGLYGTFVHYDVRNTKARWVG